MPDPMFDERYPWGSTPTIDELGEAFHDPAGRRECLRHPDEPSDDDMTACPNCDNTAHELTWFWFESPEMTWRVLCGQAGWALWCPHCETPVAFSTTIIS